MSDAPLSLPAEARRKEIVRLLLAQEAITIPELVARFHVSAMTAHRDLDELQARGVLRKVRGGATAQPSTQYESSLAYRLSVMTQAKQALGRHAVAHVEPGSSILLDDSTTCLAMVPFLAGIPGLTVVTNFLCVVEAVTQMKETDIRLIVVGGTYDPKYHSFLGLVASRALSDLRVDRCFLSVPALDPQDGVFHQEASQVRIKRGMIEVADSSILLVDSSKVPKRALHRIVGLDAFERIIVDRPTDTDSIDALRRSGATVEVAGDEGEDEAQAVGNGSRDDD